MSLRFETLPCVFLKTIIIGTEMFVDENRRGSVV